MHKKHLLDEVVYNHLIRRYRANSMPNLMTLLELRTFSSNIRNLSKEDGLAMIEIYSQTFEPIRGSDFDIQLVFHFALEEFGEPRERIWNCLRSAWISSPYIFKEKQFAGQNQKKFEATSNVHCREKGVLSYVPDASLTYTLLTQLSCACVLWFFSL